jgi:soluble lytic murein transglycosylase-like protein
MFRRDALARGLESLPLIILLFSIWTVAPEPAYSELYRYETSGGETLITTQRRSDLRLVEVISGEKKAVKPTAKAPAKAGPLRRPPKSAKKYADGDFDDIINEASRAYDVPFGFIKAVIRAESNFNPNAVSRAGAMGLMQLMPRTAESMDVSDPFDPRQNIFGGTRFLRVLIDRYQGDINLILAAYNAGDAAVKRYNGIPYPQTRGYVSSVYRWYRKYSSETMQ